MSGVSDEGLPPICPDCGHRHFPGEADLCEFYLLKYGPDDLGWEEDAYPNEKEA